MESIVVHTRLDGLLRIRHGISLRTNQFENVSRIQAFSLLCDAYRVN